MLHTFIAVSQLRPHYVLGIFAKSIPVKSIGASSIRLILTSCFLLLSSPALANQSLNPQTLRAEIGAKRDSVPEFVEIKKEAERLGLRVWLFGGSAAGYGHYVAWDLRRRSGDSRFYPDRFDYDFTNIYRSNQDMDLVVDGPSEKAAQLEQILRSRFEYFEGSKKKWEVRMLREARGDKLPLLNDFDFLNQHTDSNSTGLIEITDSKDPVVKDLRDWNASEPIFLKDLSTETLHFYFSENHDLTSRFKQGLNPPIIAAIRYLTKAFQFELKMLPGDLAAIRKIIDDFDPTAMTRGSYVDEWLERNSKKLIQNAVNIEYAITVMDGLRLRSKLRAVRRNQNTVGTMAWWLNKEALKSFPVGEGSGKTLAEVLRENGYQRPEEVVVAHETSDFSAYESITKAHTNEPNVLTSRHGAVGEDAGAGEGHYTAIGKLGRRNTGYTIRYTPILKARENTDFTILGDVVIWRNRAAFRVIQEGLQADLVDYFHKLLGLNPSEKAVFEKLRRRLKRNFLIDPTDLATVGRLVSNVFASSGTWSPAFGEWIGLATGKDYEELNTGILRKYPQQVAEVVAKMENEGKHDIPSGYYRVLSAILNEQSNVAVPTFTPLMEQWFRLSGTTEFKDLNRMLARLFPMQVLPVLDSSPFGRANADWDAIIARMLEPAIQTRPPLFFGDPPAIKIPDNVKLILLREWVARSGPSSYDVRNRHLVRHFTADVLAGVAALENEGDRAVPSIFYDELSNHISRLPLKDEYEISPVVSAWFRLKDHTQSHLELAHVLGDKIPFWVMSQLVPTTPYIRTAWLKSIRRVSKDHPDVLVRLVLPRLRMNLALMTDLWKEAVLEMEMFSRVLITILIHAQIAQAETWQKEVWSWFLEQTLRTFTPQEQARIRGFFLSNMSTRVIVAPYSVPNRNLLDVNVLATQAAEMISPVVRGLFLNGKIRAWPEFGEWLARKASISVLVALMPSATINDHYMAMAWKHVSNETLSFGTRALVNVQTKDSSLTFAWAQRARASRELLPSALQSNSQSTISELPGLARRSLVGEMPASEVDAFLSEARSFSDSQREAYIGALVSIPADPKLIWAIANRGDIALVATLARHINDHYGIEVRVRALNRDIFFSNRVFNVLLARLAPSAPASLLYAIVGHDPGSAWSERALSFESAHAI
jgi:hypothetical protein